MYSSAYTPVSYTHLAQGRHEPVDVLLVPGQSGLGQLAWGDVGQPICGVLREGDGLSLIHI